MRYTQIYLSASFLFAIILGIVVFNFLQLYEITGFKKALDGILLLSSISLGFYGACLSVFASLFNTSIVKEIMNDKSYRREFILISALTLGSGFLTVISTIIYQVMMENKEVPVILLKITNASWFGLVLIFFSLKLIFVFLSFVIFFNNTDKHTNNDNVYTPSIDESKLKKANNK